MRAIERQMLQAIHAKKDWRLDNTEVKVTYFTHAVKPIERINVYLHGNPIAQIDSKTVEVCDCGWNTPTTKSRLNVILHEFCKAGIYQKKHRWYGVSCEQPDQELEPNTKYTFTRI
jgi:hypothetical protein